MLLLAACLLPLPCSEHSVPFSLPSLQTPPYDPRRVPPPTAWGGFPALSFQLGQHVEVIALPAKWLAWVQSPHLSELHGKHDCGSRLSILCPALALLCICFSVSCPHPHLPAFYFPDSPQTRITSVSQPLNSHCGADGRRACSGPGRPGKAGFYTQICCGDWTESMHLGDGICIISLGGIWGVIAYFWLCPLLSLPPN